MTEALFDFVTDMLAEKEPKKPGDTLSDAKVETPLSALGDTRPKVGAETLAYTLSNVKAEAIVAFLADTVEEAQRDTYSNKLANIKAKTLDEIRH